MILTGYKTVNYGSVLQSFATYEMLRLIGTEPHILNLDCLWKQFRIKKIRFYLRRNNLLFIIQSKGGKYFSLITELLHPKYKKYLESRKQKFNEFLGRTTDFTIVVKNEREASELSKKFDIALLGSDQVWLPSSVVTNVYTLNFVSEKTTKIAYAPSFGISKIPERYWGNYRSMFENIDYISVREDSGRKIVEEISGKKCMVVADPVFMLSREEWNKAIVPKRLEEEEYIFCYLIGNIRWQREWIKQYAQKRKLKTVAIIHLDQRIPDDEKYFDKTIIDASPEDFLNLIRFSNVVFTDSFHCNAFSIIEHKSFWTFKRFKDKKNVSTNSRLDFLLEKVGLSDRLLTRESKVQEIINNSEIDFDKVDKRVFQFKCISYSFLLQSISKEN